MNRVFLSFFCLLLFFQGVASVTVFDAVNFVVKENSYLYEDERFEQPLVTISHQEKNYWVIPITSGESLVTFFPVKEEVKELSESRAVNRDLFKTADVLREISIEKELVSQNTAVDWIFTSTYSLRFSNLAGLLSNESFQLNTIATTLDTSSGYESVLEMNSKLSALSLSASEISLLVLDASRAENDFFSDPTTAKTGELKQKYDLVVEKIVAFDKDALEYRASVDELKQEISVSSLDPTTKTYLISLADTPPEFNSIGNYVIDSLELAQSLDGVYSRVDGRLDSLLNEFDVRLARQQAFQVLYGENAQVKQQTGEDYSSIFELVDFVLTDEYKGLWKSSNLIPTVSSNWSEALRLFNERKFSLSESFAQKALENALIVYNAGFEEQIIEPAFSNEFIYQIIFGLVGLLLVLLVFNNREKIKHMLLQKEDEEEGFKNEVY